MNVSIILPTRNRASELKQTLEAMRAVFVPSEIKAELVVVDNGSTDETAEVVRRIQLPPHFTVRRLCENQPGVANARNLGFAQTAGEIILCIDDDVRPSQNWLVEMCRPMVGHGPCAVAGGVTLAPHLIRPWMTSLHRSWLASSEWLDPQNPQGLIGANMGFSREILRHVPELDPELGPGASGFGEEQLFAWQILQAGFKIFGRMDVRVEHHFSPTRLTRKSWLDAATKRGNSHAYCGHHWEHWGSRLVRPRLIRALVKLEIWRKKNARHVSEEGCGQSELELAYRCALLRAHLHEKTRVRNYEYRGLIKLSPPPDDEAENRAETRCRSAA